MNDLITKYKKLFEIPDNLIINVNQNGNNSIFLSSDMKEADIEIGLSDELLSAFGKLKLGLEYNVLLATSYFQENINKDEEEYAKSFIYVTNPILDAWEMKIIQTYAPQEIEQELNDIINMINIIKEYKKTGVIVNNKTREIRIYLGLWAIAFVLNIKDNIDVDILYYDDDNIKITEKYLKAIKESVLKDPNPLEF